MGSAGDRLSQDRTSLVVHNSPRGTGVDRLDDPRSGENRAGHHKPLERRVAGAADREPLGMGSRPLRPESPRGDRRDEELWPRNAGRNDPAR